MNKTTYYINGNAVRELDEEAPVRRPQKSTRELEEIRRKKNRRKSARRNQERALSMNRAFVAFLTACVAASALVSVSLIQIRSNVTQQMNEVAALESRINDMKADNDARYKQITTSVDLNAIKDAAINRLGMKYASQDQIVYYSIDKNNYMDMMYKLLNALGYKDMKKNAEDSIVSMTGKKDGKTYAFACRYDIDAINGSVMEEFINAAKKPGVDVLVFMTNSSFSTSAKKACDAAGVELWDRNYIDRMSIGVDVEYEKPAVKEKSHLKLYIAIAAVVAVVLIAALALYFFLPMPMPR